MPVRIPDVYPCLRATKRSPKKKQKTKKGGGHQKKPKKKRMRTPFHHAVCEAPYPSGMPDFHASWTALYATFDHLAQVSPWHFALTHIEHTTAILALGYAGILPYHSCGNTAIEDRTHQTSRTPPRPSRRLQIVPVQQPMQPFWHTLWHFAKA